MAYQLMDIHWKGNCKEMQFEPIMKLRALDVKIPENPDYNPAFREDDEIKTIPLQNYQFSFLLSSEKYCTGYYEFYDVGTYHPCPHNVIVKNAMGTQCNHCEEKFGFKSTFFFGKPPNENMKKFLEQNFYVYLAYFAPNIIKVGTTSAKRDGRRLIEQDALFYCFIAEGTASQVREIEKTISSRFGITESVKSSHKLKSISEQLSVKKAKAEIEKLYSRIYSQLKSNDSMSSSLHSPDNISFVDMANLDAIVYPADNVHIIKNDLHIVGEYYGLRGKYLMLKNDDRIVVFNIDNLIGRKIEEFTDDWRYNIPEEEQLSLL